MFNQNIQDSKYQWYKYHVLQPSDSPSLRKRDAFIDSSTLFDVSSQI